MPAADAAAKPAPDAVPEPVADPDAEAQPDAVPDAEAQPNAVPDPEALAIADPDPDADPKKSEMTEGRSRKFRPSQQFRKEWDLFAYYTL